MAIQSLIRACVSPSRGTQMGRWGSTPPARLVGRGDLGQAIAVPLAAAAVEPSAKIRRQGGHQALAQAIVKSHPPRSDPFHQAPFPQGLETGGKIVAIHETAQSPSIHGHPVDGQGGEKLAVSLVDAAEKSRDQPSHRVAFPVEEGVHGGHVRPAAKEEQAELQGHGMALDPLGPGHETTGILVGPLGPAAAVVLPPAFQAELGELALGHGRRDARHEQEPPVHEVLPRQTEESGELVGPEAIAVVEAEQSLVTVEGREQGRLARRQAHGLVPDDVAEALVAPAREASD